MIKRKILSIFMACIMIFTIVGNSVQVFAHENEKAEATQTGAVAGAEATAIESTETAAAEKPVTETETAEKAAAETATEKAEKAKEVDASETEGTEAGRSGSIRPRRSVRPIEKSTVVISKKEVGGDFVKDAKLLVVKGEMPEDLPEDIGEWMDQLPDGSKWMFTTTGKSDELQLEPGKYTLVEVEAPEGFTKANPLAFEVGEGSNVADDTKYMGYYKFREYEATDHINDTIYLKPEGSDGKGIVVYCFNKTKLTPPKEGLVNNVRYTRHSGTGDLFTDLTTPMGEVANGIAKGPRVTGEELADAVKAVIHNGYPIDASGIKAKYNLTDGQFRYITQQAVWYYTDSDSNVLPDKGPQGVYIEANVKDAYKELLDTKTVPENLSLDIYERDNKFYQNLLSTRFANSNEIVMEEERNGEVPDKPEKPGEPDKPVVPDKPEKPGEPDKPVVPDKPEKPDEPDKPVVPNEPTNPVVPNEPTNPMVVESKETPKPKEPAESAKKGNTPKVTKTEKRTNEMTPKTADDFPMGLYMGMISISAAMFVLLGKKKQNILKG
ncbi:MAG: thioester-forming surface-anchored protein [Peptoniphilus sp.]|nr:thioester-forming surface-anchored protein [Peptoniphilus sp.]MDY3118399.1 thioester-forming surface-anchored protein [Peptoniphilus sp.]